MITIIFKFIRRFPLWILILITLIVLALAFEAGRWSVYRAHPELGNTEQVTAILTKIGQLIQLPNEQPTMVTINDAVSAKQQQPFLTNAENGDILIVYPNAAEALLYRPSTDKLIAVGPVNTGAGDSTAAPQQVQALPGSVVATSTAHAITKTKK
jgi:hypothetical protein